MVLLLLLLLLLLLYVHPLITRVTSCNKDKNCTLVLLQAQQDDLNVRCESLFKRLPRSHFV